MTSALTKVKPVYVLASLAALAYSSWPLGFWLNPNISHHYLASQLEAPHQPHRWLFIILDISVGAFLTACGYLQLLTLRSRLAYLAIFSYVTFGLMVAGAAAIPLHCDPGSGNCGRLLHHPAVMAHGSFSIGSVIFLLLGACLVQLFSDLSERMRFIWKSLLSAWAIFGIGTLLEMDLRIHTNKMQYFFMTICSLSIVLLVVSIEQSNPLAEDGLEASLSNI